MKPFKKVLAALLSGAAVMTSIVAAPVAAGAGGYTGWAMNQGNPRFYIEGNILTNTWVKYGDLYYLTGADGYVIQNTVRSEPYYGGEKLPFYVDTTKASLDNNLIANPAYVTNIQTHSLPAPFTGWKIENGQPRFYINDSLLTSNWIKYGDMYYMLGADGYVDQNSARSVPVYAGKPIPYCVDTTLSPVISPWN